MTTHPSWPPTVASGKPAAVAESKTGLDEQQNTGSWHRSLASKPAKSFADRLAEDGTNRPTRLKCSHRDTQKLVCPVCLRSSPPNLNAVKHFEPEKAWILNVVELARVPLQRTDTGILANSTTKMLHSVAPISYPMSGCYNLPTLVACDVLNGPSAKQPEDDLMPIPKGG